MPGIDPPQVPRPGSITPPSPPTAPRMAPVAGASQASAVQPMGADSGGHKPPFDIPVDIDPDQARCKSLAAIP